MALGKQPLSLPTDYDAMIVPRKMEYRSPTVEGGDDANRMKFGAITIKDDYGTGGTYGVRDALAVRFTSCCRIASCPRIDTPVEVADKTSHRG